ncbi:phosphodiester glycosidase family protein [Auraticoccus monumenti]|uniref:Sporulation related domain-containing protein n=1 Tax=Auraticoccus monumenti TaxID=675864 RepID=A0A1G6VN64_9ACTN|nr:phosphodiester glycosidase family protein [Auraticoccus monumenti]SDD54325.1 Sporulation related domain-containing protein [Auraticoccus monumenti]
MRHPAPLSTVLALACVAALGLGAAPGAAAEPDVPALPLGPAGLAQTEVTTRLADGVTHTQIVRGAPDAATPWVVELAIPATGPDPDAPARAVQDRASADALMARLAAAGFPAEVQPVRQPAVADVPASVSGYRVRLTAGYPTQEAARAAVAALRGAGFSARDWYRGWDGGSTDVGRWTVNVLTIDPRTFDGELGASYGPDLTDRESVSELAAEAGALAAVNAGFFVLDPAAGAPGDPAGAAVYDGDLVSEPVGDRPVLVLRDDARRSDVVRPTWQGSVTVDGRTRPSQRGERTSRLDGQDRVPGLVRNCGGTGDQPTDLPLHDVTCTDDGELVAFSTAFGPTTPSGPGREVVVDGRGRVVRVAEQRGTALEPGQRSVQATGDRVQELAADRTSRLRIRTTLTDGRRPLTGDGVSVVNGGPELVRDGRAHVTQARDGMVRPDDPSFAYGWALQRNPRTFAGVDARGRTVLVTVDGRQPDELGLSIPEAADVALALGLTEALNLDGGGSTAMVVDGGLVSSPSDAAGERPVGDVVYVR